MMKKDMYLKSKSHKVDLERFAGKWVALIDDQPVLWEKDISRLMQKIKKRRLPKEPSIMLVPRKDEGPYVRLSFLENSPFHSIY